MSTGTRNTHNNSSNPSKQRKRKLNPVPIISLQNGNDSASSGSKASSEFSTNTNNNNNNGGANQIISNPIQAQTISNKRSKTEKTLKASKTQVSIPDIIEKQDSIISSTSGSESESE